MIYLPDTNVWSVWLKGGDEPLRERIEAESVAGHLYLCSIVAAELRFGAVWKSHGVRNMANLNRLLDSYTVLPFDESCVDDYAILRTHLQREGKPIGYEDMLIAAIALANQLTVVTHNVREFSRVPGLKVVDWQTT